MIEWNMTISESVLRLAVNYSVEGQEEEIGDTFRCRVSFPMNYFPWQKGDNLASMEMPLENVRAFHGPCTYRGFKRSFRRVSSLRHLRYPNSRYLALSAATRALRQGTLPYAGVRDSVPGSIASLIKCL